MKKLFIVVTWLTVTILTIPAVHAQLTTSTIRGSVLNNTGETLPGATVIVLHEPTGTSYGTTTNASGIYTLANLNSGGPYTLTVSFIGHNTFEEKGIHLTLGQTLQRKIELSEAATELGEILIVSRPGVVEGNTTGSKTTVSNERIANMPSISRGISDMARLTPQAKVTSSGGLAIAGQNNRYNSFTIDGAVQNDVFGLAENGTNGGQIGINPMSMDIIDQITISLSPYDATQSGFSGAGINAVTKSGTNRFDGTAYYYFRNENLAGKTPTDNPEIEREKLDEFTSHTYGFTLGGPILKNKLFFFTNVEIQRDNTPKPFDFADYTGTATKDDIERLASLVKTKYNYDPGSYENTKASLDAEKIFAKIDWNINQSHKFSIRHQYSHGQEISPGTSSSTNIYFSNTGRDFGSTTHSTTAELKSIVSNKFANKLMIGYINVKDNRDPLGANFPYVSITDERIYLGSEQFSTANFLKQKAFSFTDDFSIYSGVHTVTIGMHHEYYDFNNVFIRQNFGVYTYDNLENFLAGFPANRYQRSFSNIDNITGDGTSAAAKFKVLQLGFYAQDDFQVTDNFNLTYGLRADIPIYLDDPLENTDINSTVLPWLESTYETDLMGAKTGAAPKAAPLFSPRIGFNWDIKRNKTMQLRGGVGLFTSRIPYVWPGGMFTNNGLMVGGIDVREGEYLNFNPDWQNQPTVEGVPSGQIDLFAEDFKMPQVLRTNIAFDKNFSNGIQMTIDVTYTKNINNVTYQNLFLQDKGKKLTGTGDNRTIWENISPEINSIAEGNYSSGIFLGSNTSKGRSFNIMGQVEKDWHNGLFTSAAYTWGRSMSINDGESSQNSSQWRVGHAYGRNRLELGRSVYDLGHRVIASVSYKWEYSKLANTTFSLFYNGQSGQTYSYGYYNGGSNGPIGDDTDNQSLTLLYVPKAQNDIILTDYDRNGTSYTAEQQWADLDKFIESHKSLRNKRGSYVTRGSERLPFENIVDLKIIQEFRFNISPSRQNRIQLAFDIFNFTNMLNKNWGRMHYPLGNYNVYQLLTFTGYQSDGTTPSYQYTNANGNNTYGIDDAGLQSSRWQAQFSVRYVF